MFTEQLWENPLRFLGTLHSTWAIYKMILTFVTTAWAMYENYRCIIQHDAGVFAWVMACNSFTSELKIFFEIPKCLYSFEECN